MKEECVTRDRQTRKDPGLNVKHDSTFQIDFMLGPGRLLCYWMSNLLKVHEKSWDCLAITNSNS